MSYFMFPFYLYFLGLTSKKTSTRKMSAKTPVCKTPLCKTPVCKTPICKTPIDSSIYRNKMLDKLLDSDQR